MLDCTSLTWVGLGNSLVGSEVVGSVIVDDLA